MDHVEKAKQYFAQKYHCSQSVLAAFADEVGLTEEQALKLGGCFGGGMCKGEVCGACTGALMALGMKYGQTDISDMESRNRSRALAIELLDTFRQENGSYICSELLKCNMATDEGRQQAAENGLFKRSCPEYVASAAVILERLLKD